MIEKLFIENIEMEDKLANYEKGLLQMGQFESLRILRDIDHKDGFLMYEGKNYLNFSSNDYLGLASEEGLQQEFLTQWVKLNSDPGLTAASSRLLTGNHKEYSLLEKDIRDAYRKTACLVFNSGYHANLGILPALAGKKDLILSDKLIHASLIDGIRLSKAQNLRYQHLSYDHLEQILDNRRKEFEQVFIVTESIFSMDGDIADFKQLVRLKKKYNAFLYVDEAHAVGVRGGTGLGCLEEQDCVKDVDLIVGTFGKALASQGAYLVCDKVIRNYLINTMRTLIYTTALPPINVAWTRFVFNRLPQLEEKRVHLENMAKTLRREICNKGMKSAGESHIVPCIYGDNSSTIKAADELRGKGFFVLPLRPPTVLAGTSRLRFSLSAAMNINMIDDLLENLPVKFVVES